MNLGFGGFEMGYKVFISHAVSDMEYAQSIKENLELHGIEAFLSDTSVKPGQYSGKDTEERIENSELIFLLLSKNALTSEHIEKEIGLARANGKEDNIIPFKLEEVDASRLIEEDKYYIPLYTEYEENLNELINWIYKLEKPSEWKNAVKTIVFIAVAAIGFVPLRKD